MTDLASIEHTPWRATDLPPRTIETLTADLAEAQRALTDARAARHKADIAVRGATDSGDRRNLPELNKASVEAGRRISTLELEFAAAKRRLEMAELQAATMKARAAAPLTAEKLFEVVCSDGRRVRHRAGSREALQHKLEPGYRVLFEVAGTDPDGNGGVNADSLREWLIANGFGGAVITLPSNNRPAA